MEIPKIAREVFKIDENEGFEIYLQWRFREGEEGWMVRLRDMKEGFRSVLGLELKKE